MVSTGELKEIEEYDVDFDHQFLETEKYDAKHIRKMNVNQLSLAELRKHPYLDFYQAKEIVNYRRTG